MTIDTSKLRDSTKHMLGLAFGFGTLMQIPAVSQVVYGLTKEHPHIAAILTSLVASAMLLHNPEVQAVLGIKETVTVKKEEVVLAPNGEATK